jgi:hypothetical protein
VLVVVFQGTCSRPSLGAYESTAGHMFVRASHSLMRKRVHQGINARDATLRYVLCVAANRSAWCVRGVGTVCRITRMQRHHAAAGSPLSCMWPTAMRLAAITDGVS